MKININKSYDQNSAYKEIGKWCETEDRCGYLNGIMSSKSHYVNNITYCENNMVISANISILNTDSGNMLKDLISSGKYLSADFDMVNDNLCVNITTI